MDDNCAVCGADIVNVSGGKRICVSCGEDECACECVVKEFREGGG